MDLMRIFYLGQKVTIWVSKDSSDHLGRTQVITSYYLGQSYYLGRNKYKLLVEKSMCSAF